MNSRDPKKTGRVIVLGILFLLLVGANLFCFLYRKPVASAPNTKNEYVPKPQSKIFLRPKPRVQVNETPMPASPSVTLAAVQESAFYLSEWAALEMDYSLEPDLFPTSSPDNPGGDVTGDMNPNGPGAGTFVASAIFGGYSAGSGGGGYTIPTGFTMPNSFGSSPSSGPGAGTEPGDDNSIPDLPLSGSSDGDAGDTGDGSDDGFAAAGSGDPGDTQDPGDPDNPMPPDSPYLCVLGGSPPPPPDSDPQTSGEATHCPEPATGILLLCAIASSAALRRRKRRKA